MSEGRVFYVIGASEPGKNKLLAYARTRLDDSLPIMFAHRYTTRPSEDDGANEVVLSGAEFDLRRRLRLFVMDWEVSGFCYGVGTEINYWLAMGLSVVVNGLRAHLERALNAYPDMTVIWLTDEPEVGAGLQGGPLVSDARSDLATRPVRNSIVPAPGCRYRMVHVSNAGSVALAGKKLVSVLVGQRG